MTETRRIQITASEAHAGRDTIDTRLADIIKAIPYCDTGRAARQLRDTGLALCDLAAKLWTDAGTRDDATAIANLRCQEIDQEMDYWFDSH